MQVRTTTKKEDLSYQKATQLMEKAIAKRKAMLSYKRTLTKTTEDLSKEQAIDIPTQSSKNLLRIKERLKNADYLPQDEKKALLFEKKDAILTVQEKRLFQVLIDKPYILQHTTSAALLQKILQESKELIDPQEAKRRKIETRTTTPAFGGNEHNVFFGFGTLHSSIPYFVRNRRNEETKAIEEYATVQIDFEKILRSQPDILSNLWTGGHFAHFENAIAEPKIAPVKLGDTEFYWKYGVEHLFSAKEKNIKYLTFTRPDKTTLQLPLGMEEEIATGKDILPFIAYSFIERLRMIGGKTRAALLENPEDQQSLDLLIEKLFRVDDFEVHIPVKMPLSAEYTRILTPAVRFEMTSAMSQAAARGDTSSMEYFNKWKQYPLDGYMYEDTVQETKKPLPDLPIIAAIKDKQRGAIRWLIDNGANPSLFHTKKNALYQSLLDADILNAIANRSIITEIFKLNDTSFLNELLKMGLDLNYYFHSTLRFQKALKSPARTFDFDDSVYDGSKADIVFIEAIKHAAQFGTLDILSKVYPLLDYTKSESTLLLEDCAFYGDERVFTYVFEQISKKAKLTIDYFKLFSIAAIAGNLAMVSFLNLKNKFTLSKDYRKKIQDLIPKLVQHGETKAVDWLLKEIDCNPTQIKNFNNSALIYLYHNSDSDSREFLQWFFKTTEMNPLDSINGMSLLSQAIKKNHENAKWLIDEYKLNFSKNESATEEICHALAETGNIDLFEHFIKKGFPLKITPELLANVCAEKHAELLEWLLKKDSSAINEMVVCVAFLNPSPEVHTVLSKYTSIQKPSPQTLMTIYEIDEKSPEAKNVDIYFLNMMIQGQDPQKLDFLIKHFPFDPKNHKDVFRKLFENVIYMDIAPVFEKIDWLINHGIDPNENDSAGNTLMDNFFQDKDYFKFTQVFFDHMKKHGISSEPWLKKYGMQALHYTLDSYEHSPQIALVSYLLKQGVDVNTNVTDVSPLAKACQLNDLMLVKGFLNRGADPNKIFSPKEPITIYAWVQKNKPEWLDVFKPYMTPLKSGPFFKSSITDEPVYPLI